MPCELCGHANTQKHRVIPGQWGGQYVKGNVAHLCPNHHSGVHLLMRARYRGKLKNESEQERYDDYRQDVMLMTFWKKRVKPIVDARLRLEGRWTPESVYLAGKIKQDDWRKQILDPNSMRIAIGEGKQLHCTGPVYRNVSNYTNGSCDCGNPHVCVGPPQCDTEERVSDDLHGAVDLYKHSDYEVRSMVAVHEACKSQIADSDILFAWVDSQDCFGTIFEIGYASSLNIPILIASPHMFGELWFTYMSASQVLFGCDSPYVAFMNMLVKGEGQKLGDDGSPIPTRYCWVSDPKYRWSVAS